jgi:hypothetical protein
LAEIVNLRLARKRKARAVSERQAEEQRARFGRSKAELGAEAGRRAREGRRLDDHRLDSADEP